MNDKPLTEERFNEILKQKGEENKKKTRKRIIFIFAVYLIFIIFIGIFFLSIIKIYFYNSFIENGINAFEKINQEKNSKYVIEWFYQCPSYQYQFYNCPRELSYQNITGYYCNKTILCENFYKIHLKENRTE